MDDPSSCPICDASHRPSACPHALEAAVWDGHNDDQRVLAGDVEAVRGWVASRAMAPLSRLLRDADREVEVLETVNADSEQRRRLRRSRRISRALRHLRQKRRDEAMQELVEAERDHPADPQVALASAFVLMLDDHLDEAVTRLEAMADDASAEMRLDAMLTAARLQLVTGHVQQARSGLAEVAEAEQNERRSEARYLLARCLVLDGNDGHDR
jgi:predicted Zn-dependent protease